MTAMKLKSLQIIDKANVKNTNILYFICLFIVVFINIILNHKESFHTWVEIIGSIIQIAIPMYVLVPVLWKKDKGGAIQMIRLLAIILGVTWAFKLGLGQVFGINEMRPRGGSMSFPSGHTSGAFSGALFLTIRYGWKYAVYSLPLAMFVGYTRIYSMAHWPIDVIASIVLCTISSILIVKKFKQ
ncbi:phosphatase PAP2 family protein [Silvanigrella sp.]|jgi:membrane-associated phospholipid phosphatase|uniref:phosphatase PAP2 family protein n=1 Tax=Silvanigrella sp. TaxID=2024976 RepID=UPI0037C5D0D3|nr:phosphatase PAP2 family protein [Silvanigrellaceae bacterium]